jgi:hypothetical protein
VFRRGRPSDREFVPPGGLAEDACGERGRLSLTAPCLRLRLVFEIFDGLQVAFLGGGENIIKG